MSNEITKKTSKFLSLLLRHKPETIGLRLDEQGWASIEELIALSAEHGRVMDRELIQHVVATNDKGRFAISDDGRFIRANQGHSIAVDLGLEAIQPPEKLYHGTATRFLESIFAQGLQKGNRQHVHLSEQRDTAISVGRRYGKVVILTVSAGLMQQSGYLFFQSKNGVWLTENVPLAFLSQEEKA